MFLLRFGLVANVTALRLDSAFDHGLLFDEFVQQFERLQDLAGILNRVGLLVLPIRKRQSLGFPSRPPMPDQLLDVEQRACAGCSISSR